MTEKEMLLKLIISKGRCLHYHCFDGACPLKDHCTLMWDLHKKTNEFASCVYMIAMMFFLKKFGKGDLVEALI